MQESTFEIRMLGEFSIRYQGREISDRDNRSKKIWLLLACLIYCRKRTLSNEELIDLLWSMDTHAIDQANALKTMFHRLRTMLNQLGDGMGHTLIIRQEGSYIWNPEVPLSLDVEEFESYIHSGATASQPSTRLKHFQQALSYYHGDFLSRFRNELWVVPIASHLHEQYLELVQQTIVLLEARHRWEDIVRLCQHSIALEPYSQTLHLYWMDNLIRLGREKEAVQIYEDMSHQLRSALGMMPSPELTALYRRAGSTLHTHTISLDLLQEQLCEPDHLPGALLCDYDFFCVIYHAEARALSRNGDAVHVALLSITSQDGMPLPQRSLTRCVENLQRIIRMNLRKGDVAALCSTSQFIVMLPHASYENSQMIVSRILSAFRRQYPHSPAQIQYAIQPMRPAR